MLRVLTLKIGESIRLCIKILKWTFGKTLGEYQFLRDLGHMRSSHFFGKDDCILERSVATPRLELTRNGLGFIVSYIFEEKKHHRLTRRSW